MGIQSLSKETVFYLEYNKYKWEVVKNYTYEECLSQDDSPESLSEFEDLYNGEDCSDWICDYYVRIFLPQDKDCDIYVWNEFDIKLSDGRMCSAQSGGYMYLKEDSIEDGRMEYQSNEIPQEILNELSEANMVKKLTVKEFEQMHADMDYYLSLTVRCK